MGLSATQMRLLCVTARKTNVEYQGQQINQSRTILANQAADIATELGNLKCPTAPSQYKYILNPVSKPVIDWTASVPEVNEQDFEVYYAANQPKFSDFNIPQYQEETDESGTKTGKLQLITYDEDGNKKLGSAVDPSDIQGTYCYNTTGNAYIGSVSTTTTTTVTDTTTSTSSTVTTTETKPSYKTVNYTNIVVPEDAEYYYNASTNEFKFKEGYDENSIPTSLKYYNLAASYYSAYSATKQNLIYDGQPDNPEEATASGVELTATEKASNAQYEAAMRQYEQEVKEYNAAYAELEQQTKDVQAIDKKLELQMKQLETEREAINTEYESLQKVIQKNIEQTYKAFNA